MLKMLRERGEISGDLMLMVDEMYRQKGTQYQREKHVGADEEGNAYKGTAPIIVVGIEQKTSFIVQALSTVLFILVNGCREN